MNTNNDNPIVTVADISEVTVQYRQLSNYQPTLEGSSTPPPNASIKSTQPPHSTSQELPVSTTATNAEALGAAVVKKEQEMIKLPKAFLSTPVRSKDQLVARIKEELSTKELRKQDIERIEFGNVNICSVAQSQIESKNAFVFTLDSCTEKRNAVWSYRLFEGKVYEEDMSDWQYDPPLMGPAPKIEEMSIIPTDYFHSFQFSTPIPHTDFLVRCDHCNGMHVLVNELKDLGMFPVRNAMERVTLLNIKTIRTHILLVGNARVREN